jgi:hypothetical protein
MLIVNCKMKNKKIVLGWQGDQVQQQPTRLRRPEDRRAAGSHVLGRSCGSILLGKHLQQMSRLG